MVIENKKGPGIKNIVMLVISVALGGVGVFASKTFIEKKISFYKSQMDVKEELVEVVVPKKNLMRGQIITGDVLSLRSFPKKYMDSNAVTEAGYQIAVGQKLNFDIDGGKPLLWAHLEGGVNPTFSGKIQDGFRALTIRVDEINSISGFLQPKDNVDLLITYDGKEVGGKKVTMPFMQNLHILATGVKTQVDKTGKSANKRYSTVTVQVTPEDAKKIILAQDVGKITAALRHPDDNAPMAKTAIGIHDILGIKSVVNKKKVVKKENGIEFIIGGV